MSAELSLERNRTGRWLTGLAGAVVVWLFAYLQLPAFADGMVGLREAAVQKMLKGETTLDEVIRVTGEKT